MNSTNLSIQWLAPNPSFNWFFLLELIVACILVVFFLLYFNRLFATVLSYGIRAYTWHYYRAYVDIHAVQISLLSGRVFFKGIRYHGVNETIFIHGGFVTWHYWRRKVKQTDLSNTGDDSGCTGNEKQGPLDGNGHSDQASIGEQGGVKGEHADGLACRITAKLYGLEWFIYNRTPAYDSILAGFGVPVNDDYSSGDDNASFSSPRYTRNQSEKYAREEPFEPTVRNHPTSSSAPQSTHGRKSEHGHHEDGKKYSHSSTDSESPQELGVVLSRLLKLLPMNLMCKKGAVVVGNENTRSVLATTFDNATGSIEACNSGVLDLYRQIFSFQFSHPVIQLKPNPDFKQNQFAAAKGLGPTREDQHGSKRKRDTLFNYRFQKRRIWHSVRDLIPYFQTSVESFRAQLHADTPPRNRIGVSDDVRWAGLSRYLDETSEGDHEKWNAVEYARFSTIVDSPSISITYYWDIAGRVGPQVGTSSSSAWKGPLDLNGAPPPEWGVDVKLEGGSINYGPWADRERAGLQNVFFPNSYRSAEPAAPLSLGNQRQSTAFKFRVEISDETTLRIPTREQSKDWQWKGRADTIGGTTSRLKKQQQKRQPRNKEGDKGYMGADIRPFGWLSLRVSGDSTIDYTMDMVASDKGFANQLSLDLRDSKLLSSVNHGVLWQCPRQLVTCDLSNPLSWNSLRTWNFDVESQQLELFLLRDHIFLLTDLVADWSSGPPSDYYTFVPFIYNLNLSFSNFRLFVNVNDLNIISNPADLEDNRLVVIKGRELTSDVMIPLNRYKPEQNTVEFNVNLQDGDVDFLSPLWDTLHTFLQDKSMATLESLFIAGSYNYYLTTSSDLTDTLVLNVDGVSPRLYLFGFLIRSFMAIKDNYFGDEMHFKTLEEFQELANSKEQSAAPHGINPNRKSNDMDVMVHVTVDNPCALLPENLYDHTKCLALNAPLLEADLRFTNYYMDMQFALTPLKAALEWRQLGMTPVTSATQLFIDGVSIHGHRLFGLPPSEPTYVCNWDFDVGRVIGECSTEFVACLTAGLQSFDMSFDNEENALPSLHPTALDDVTFLRAKIGMINVSVLLDQSAFIFSTEPLTATINDWAHSEFSKRLSLLAPEVSIAAVNRRSASRVLELSDGRVTPLALFQTAVNLKMAQRKSDFDESRALQQEHIRIHDKRTHRTPWLLFDWEGADSSSLFLPNSKMNPPNIAVPPMPEPIPENRHLVGLTSVKHAADLRSAASSKSFLVSPDASSLRSGKNQGARSTKSSPSLVSGMDKTKRQTSTYSNLATRTPNQMKRSKSSEHRRESASTAGVDDSNPWAMPNFSLYKIALDTSQLPLYQGSDGDSRKDNPADMNLDPILSHFEDKTTHTNFSCMFPSGVKGFCTPDFLFIVSALLKELQPKHPHEIIDLLQKSTISEIVTYQKSLSKPKKSTGFAIRVPAILFKLVNLSESPEKHEVDCRDEYSIAIYNLKTEFRTKVERRKGDLLEGVKESTTIHAEAGGLWLSVEGSGANPYQEKAAFSLRLGDMNFWLATTPNVRSHVQMRDFDVVTSTKSVEHLAFLVRRTTTMFDYVTSSFQHSSSLTDKRLRFLVYSLTQSAAGIPDPTFLARVSYVLRVAPAHLRQHDSWKIISRVRNIFNSLSSDKQQELALGCLDNNISVPRNAKSAVFSSFDQWRSWDLAHVEKSYVMRKIWSAFESNRNPDTRSLSLSSTVRLFRFSIDPGPKESDFMVENLSTAVSITPEKENNPENGPLETPTKIIVLQSYCSSTSLRLRWEILDLVQEVMRAMSTVTLESATPPETTGAIAEEKRELQIMLGADFGSITLDGININTSLAGKALRGSLVQKVYGNDEMENISVLLSADACSTELSRLSKTLMLWRIDIPYLYCSRVSEESKSEQKHDWRVVGSCSRLRFDMKEDPLSLAHIAERLIEDETRCIRQIVSDFNIQTRHVKEIAPAKKPTRNQFYIATFLDDYQLTFSILPYLIYAVSGEVARASLMPTKESKIEVDFDLKRNSHVFMSNEGDKWHTLSALKIPPINGRVLASMLPDQTEIDADLTIELIHLEASSVRSLLGALTGPEVSNLVSDLKENVAALQSNLDDALALNKEASQPKEPSSNHTILYGARLTMAGVGIHAIAPGLSGKDYSADLGFNLGMVRMRLDNGLEKGHAVVYPEFHVDVAQASLALKKREKSRSRSFGSLVIDARLLGSSVTSEHGEPIRTYHLSSGKFDVELFPESAALVVDIATHLQERIKTLDLSQEVKRFKKLRQLSQPERKPNLPEIRVNDDPGPQSLFNAIYSLEFNNIQVGWNMATASSAISGRFPDDLVFSIKRVDLSNKRKNSAKLRIEGMELQMVPPSFNRRKRSLNSALMPELVFNVAYSSNGKELRLAFQAAGKSLDMRATSEFILPASMIRDSIASASQTLREGNAIWVTKPSTDGNKGSSSLFGNRRLRSVLVDVDFAGAVVSLQGKQTDDPQTMLTATLKGSRLSKTKYGQYVQGDTITTATFRAPGVAVKVQFEDNGTDDPALNAEMKVDASTNVLYPTLVPLIKQMTATVKEVMGEQEQPKASSTMKLQPQLLMQETPFHAKDPDTILGRCRVNVGLLICKQEFSLSCQPIARVAATARFDSVYVTVNTVQSDDHGRFISLLVACNTLGASVKHVYSNESTASFDVNSIVMSVMNSKHLRSTKGITAILRVSPMAVAVNAKQVQDFMLFREIWLASNDEGETEATSTFQGPPSDTQTYIVQRYQQVASASVFPWNATIAIEKLEIQLDLGSTLGRAQLGIHDLWLSSKKTSDREQTLYVNFDTIGVESKGRMSGMVELRTLKVRTSIQWPDEKHSSSQTPLIQASISFHQLQAKASFDYQPFLVTDIAMFEFLMYNVRDASETSKERLFSILDGGTVQVFCTSLTASQCIALFQAWQRLVQDKQAAYEASLREIERYLRRKASTLPEKIDLHPEAGKKEEDKVEKAPISLQTGVVVTVKAINIGAFPSSLFDNQIFKLNATDAQARFDVTLEEGQIRSALGLTLGELRVALSGANRPSSADMENFSVDEVARRATGARGGTILKVPQLVARMETWQSPGSHHISYLFRSTFEGKVDVGWNYSRISFIRDMWEAHSRALASRLGKPLPPSAVRITGGPGSERDRDKNDQQEKITAVVNVPQSKYTYTALEPPIIETPQLRDMGEATPPLEWIGLHRDKLPNVTHQIIIVTLLEVATEVEDAYSKILGAS